MSPMSQRGREVVTVIVTGVVRMATATAIAIAILMAPIATLPAFGDTEEESSPIDAVFRASFSVVSAFVADGEELSVLRDGVQARCSPVS